MALPERIRLLGEEVDLVTPGEVVDFIAAAVAERRPALVANHNAHSLHLVRTSPEMRAVYEQADLIEADSTPLIAWGRLTGRAISRAHRCTYLDWRGLFWSRAAREGWRVFYLGGAPGVAEAAGERLAAEFPGAVIAACDGYFDIAPGGSENEEVLGLIAAFRPDVLLVGMGMPRQEVWIARNRAALPPCAVLPVGAAFDYEAGVQQAAPRWMGRAGLEWLFRLCADPGRLAGRYLVEPWRLAPALVRDLRDVLRGQPAGTSRTRLAPPPAR